MIPSRNQRDHGSPIGAAVPLLLTGYRNTGRPSSSNPQYLLPYGGRRSRHANGNASERDENRPSSPTTAAIRFWCVLNAGLLYMDAVVVPAPAYLSITFGYPAYGAATLPMSYEPIDSFHRPLHFGDRVKHATENVQTAGYRRQREPESDSRRCLAPEIRGPPLGHLRRRSCQCLSLGLRILEKAARASSLPGNVSEVAYDWCKEHCPRCLDSNHLPWTTCRSPYRQDDSKVFVSRQRWQSKSTLSLSSCPMKNYLRGEVRLFASAALVNQLPAKNTRAPSPA